MSNQALVLIDFINEIIHPKGKLAAKGYSDFVDKYAVASNVTTLLKHFRAQDALIVHVRVGFEPSYSDHPIDSPLFGAAKQYGALDCSAWGFEFADFATPESNETVIRKRRVSAFYGTSLELILRAQKIDTVFLAGCATDLAIESAARDAHDRDFKVHVVLDCCAAATYQDHEISVSVLSKIAQLTSVTELTS
jgi:nicotinamidase-related amidase